MMTYFISYYKLFSFCFLACFLTLHTSNAVAQVEIEIVINNEPVTNADIRQRQNLIKITGAKGNLYQIARNEIIDGILQIQEAKRQGIKITDSEINRELNAISKRTGLTLSQLRKELSRNGSSLTSMRKRIHAQIAWVKILRNFIGSQEQVGDHDITAVMLERGLAGNKLKSYEYNIQQITIAVPARASEKEKQHLSQKASSLIKRFKDCNSGITEAKQIKQAVVKAQGWRLETTFPPQYLEILEKTQIGKLAGPFKTTLGLELIALCDKRELASDITKRQEIKKEILARKNQTAARQYMQNLRRLATIVYK